MSQQKLLQTLQEIGLTDKESSVYLAALKLGSSSALQLSRSSGVKRGSVYAVIETLEAKGLMSIQVKGFKRYFKCSPPERLESLLESRKNMLEKAMPELQALQLLKESQSLVRYYEGQKNVRIVYDELLRDAEEGKDYYVISNQDRWFSLDSEFYRKFLTKRSKRNFKIKCILIDSAIAREHQKLSKNFSMEVKIMPQATQFDANMVIIPRKLVVHQLVPKSLAIVIENRAVTKTMSELFRLIWDSLK
jgi:sugar-specific transcriptional regulator TrmB